LVNAKRILSESANGALQGTVVTLADVEPWPEPVNGAEVLGEIVACIERYIVLPDGAADAVALWAVHAHAYEAFIHTPRLNFRSPEKGCGKTTALDVLAVLTPRALRTESLTPAVLFRLVEGHKPTLLLDETDSYLKEADELRGLLNAGHKRGAMAYRCEGENNTVRGFAAFAPGALAGIGELPGTLHDRAIVVKLVRAKPEEVTERFDSRRTNKEVELCRKCARWTVDNFEALKDCDPRLPETAFNRLADNWRPLFAIAQVMGEEWPKRVGEAFAKLTSTFDLDAQGVGTTLLADIASIFSEEGTDKLPSAKLADLLAAIEGRPWAEWGRLRKPISPNQLANLLRHFGISPQGIRIGNETPRGYLLSDFTEAFQRYISPGTPSPECNSAT
jgi:putative DNA primase/helicase